MEIENKLDEDFLFYLGFVTNYFHNLRDQADIDKCQVCTLFILLKVL